MELIFGNICEPIAPSMLGDNKYFLLIVDDFSRLMYVSLIQYQYDAFNAFEKFKALAEVEKGVKLKILKTNR